jgi:pyruvate formate lyase activating enzyme
LDKLTCHVIEITRGSTHDGPGMRTTVFLKGCPLRCAWCQNPESMSFAQEVWWEQRKCIGCLECVAVCQAEALSETPAGIQRDRQKCTLCGACVEECPAKARTFTGEEWGIEALLKEVLKDQDYYRAFGGGVTLSGGEPLSQAPFVAEFFRRLQAAGVHTALDTCGLASPASLAAVLPRTDHVLFDIKLLDPALHQRFTGQSNEIILRNLAAVATFIRQAERPMKLWIRTPLIPGATATPENIAAISRFIHETLSDVTERWELCAFNPTCKSKYDKLDLPWAYEGYALLGREMAAQLRETAAAHGMSKDAVFVTGLLG